MAKKVRTSGIIRSASPAQRVESSTVGGTTYPKTTKPQTYVWGFVLAPRVGLEPTTLRLQYIRRFHAGLDYLIIPLLLGVGRF